jgi:hypothetical protein
LSPGRFLAVRRPWSSAGGGRHFAAFCQPREELGSDEIEEALLLQPDLVQIDVIETGVDVLANRLQVYLGVVAL